jgi:hypothetical protein
VITLSNTMVTVDEHSGAIRALLARLGPGAEDSRIAGVVRVLLAYDPKRADGFEARLEQLAQERDPAVAGPAGQWLSHVRENSGDPAGAVAAAERALARADDEAGPWSEAMLHTQLAQLTMHLGDRGPAVEHARAALPVMRRLGATDDEVQLRSLLVLCAIGEGDLKEAEAELERIDRVDDGEVFGGIAVRQIGAAELALAHGDRAGGLRTYRESAEAMRALRFPGIPTTGLEPWVLFGESTALTAHAHHATAADVGPGRALFRSCRERAVRYLDPDDPQLDVPVAGMVLFSLGAWGLLRDAAPADDAVRLLALAERFAYNRAIPTMAWERMAPRAEERAPGRIAAWLDRYGDRRPHDLLGEARALVEQIAA